MLKFFTTDNCLLTLLQIDEICLLKLSLESILTPKRTTYSLFKQQECCLKSEFVFFQSFMIIITHLLCQNNVKKTFLKLNSKGPYPSSLKLSIFTSCIVQRWQRKVNRLTHVQSCWFAYYTSSIFDVLIEVELFDLKVPISLIDKARLDSLKCYRRVTN